MKSLEERAHDFARKVYTNGQEWWEDSSSIITLGKSCYIKGAEEQRKIDIKKLCDYMCECCPTKLDIMAARMEACNKKDKEECIILEAVKTYMEE